MISTVEAGAQSMNSQEACYSKVPPTQLLKANKSKQEIGEGDKEVETSNYKTNKSWG